MHNITLRNVQQYGTLLPPGVIRCNSTNPCTGFVFENVRAHGWWRILGLSYIVENVFGIATSSKPDPGFLDPLTIAEPRPSADFTAFVKPVVISNMLNNSN